jgi:2-polyprenyl-3-methyl-5-hydroxy-6-metoxy-1,4-benzoquinol methylase
MSVVVTPKSTSYAYGEAYQREQVEKHRNRQSNHWQQRIALAHRLVNQWVLPRFEGRSPDEITILDVGCSIGTMAIEFALRGFNACGVDFDASALAIGRDLSREEGVSVQFFEGDVSDWQCPAGTSLDIALCFDIFEHLHDDELGALLQSIRRRLNPRGALVFYTFPLQFDYIFYSRAATGWPLVPFLWMPPKYFERIVRAYAALLDLALLLVTGNSYEERIKKRSHCNPTTSTRLLDILSRAGYEIPFIETDNIYSFSPNLLRRFGKQPIAHRNLYGIAYPLGA